MIALLLGALALLLLVMGMRAFERASIKTIKSLIAWIAALAGLVLVLLLVLTGRGPIAFFALSFLYPLLRQHWSSWRARAGLGQQGGQGPAPGSEAPRSRAGGPMSSEEAYDVLGLKPGASEEDIQAAYRRLMRAAHPDRGGSDWVAARVNQARDVLLGGRKRSRTG
ncbi:MAG: DnaJ domain-containing protein [Alphaproteobacteria bacterium]|nr:DnaJ domain-containing protein [Alphaproteobacteria bacterium]